LSLADRTQGHCHRLLGDAVRALGGHAGAIFEVHDHDRAHLVVTDGANQPDERTSLERAALKGLAQGRTTFVEALWPATSGQPRSVPSGALVVPVYLDGAVVAVLVVSGLELAERAVEECERRVDQFVFPIALSIDRWRMENAIDQRGADITALRRQLDAYAVDFRATYLAEKDRSQQLAAALRELEETYIATVRGLAIAVEAKDEVTGGHIHRVCRYGMLLTALVAPDHADDPQFKYGFLLHDVGKLTVPDNVLTKPGALSESEWALMKQHPGSGRSILADIPFLEGAREIVYAHHERWDGNGYPRGLAGDEIPLGAQIFPLCDAFDAMTSDRPYRKASPVDHARDEIRKGGGGQFWPEAVDAFLSLPVDELEAVRAASRTSST
jgi:HD-GYP domain-containing protein (c-di-GMP phosphodiesterase class II)